MVFDRYLPNLAKEEKRSQRRGGKSRSVSRNVESREQRIGDWSRFIVLEDNKTSLAHFLSTEMSQSYNAYPPRRELTMSSATYWTYGHLISHGQSFEGLAPNHEEACMRIVLHARDATIGSTVRLTFCVVIKMFLSSYWHTACGKIFVKTYGCLLERQKESSTYPFTRSLCRRRRESHC